MQRAKRKVMASTKDPRRATRHRRPSSFPTNETGKHRPVVPPDLVRSYIHEAAPREPVLRKKSGGARMSRQRTWTALSGRVAELKVQLALLDLAIN